MVGGPGQQLTQPQQASLYLQQQQQQTQRGSPVNAISTSSSQIEGRPQERVAGYSHSSYQPVNPASSDLSAYYQPAVSPYLMYPQLAAAQAQALTSMASGTAIRPNIGNNCDSAFSAHCLRKCPKKRFLVKNLGVDVTSVVKSFAQFRFESHKKKMYFNILSKLTPGNGEV